MNLVHNELAKLTATYVNGLAIAIFAVGGLAPLFTSLYAASSAPISGWAIALISTVCFVGSGALHLLARQFLRG